MDGTATAPQQQAETPQMPSQTTEGAAKPAETPSQPEKKTFDKTKAQLEEQKSKLTPDKANQYEAKAADDAAERTLIEEANRELEAGNPEKAKALLKAYHQEKSRFNALAKKGLDATRENQPRPNAAEAAEGTTEEELETTVKETKSATDEQEALKKTLLDLQNEIKALEEALTELGLDISTLPDLSKLSPQELQKLYLETQKSLGRTNLVTSKAKELGLLTVPTPETSDTPAETTPQISEEERIKQLVKQEVARIIDERQKEQEQRKPLTAVQKVIELGKLGGGYALMLMMLLQIFTAEMEK